MRLPADLRTAANGRLAPHLLVPAHIPGGNWLLHPLAARSMRAMVAAMTAAGFQVRATGTYRTHAAQVNLLTSRYRPVSAAVYHTTPRSRRRLWRDAPAHGFSSIHWVKIPAANGSYPATAATPGESNHGLALAVDFAEERDGDPGVEAISAAMTAWLVANAATYGWSAELQSEPWHWRYVAADAVPAAVISFEVGLQAPPPAPIPAPAPAPAPASGAGVDLAQIAAAIARAKAVVLREGSGGPGASGEVRDAVTWCQIGLARAGYDVGSPRDLFDQRTALCVHAFQMDRRLRSDGVVGPVTWSHLWP